jgi:hypothetical protein
MAKAIVIVPHRKAAALSALIAGSTKFSPQDRAIIISELREITNLKKAMPQNRRNLFQIVHAIRACDSSMTRIVQHHGFPLTSPSMGNCLRAFRDIPVLPFSETDRQHYQSRLVRRRNALMHQAGDYPAGRQEVTHLLDLMSACLSRVL